VLLKRSRNPHGKQGRDSEPVNARGHIDAEQDREPVGLPTSSARGSVRKDRILATEFLTRQRSNAQPSSSSWAFKAAATRLFAAHCSVYWPPALAHGRPAPAAGASIERGGRPRRLAERARPTMAMGLEPGTAACVRACQVRCCGLADDDQSGGPAIGLTHGRPSLGRAAVSQSSSKVLRRLPARGGVYRAGDLSGSLADAGG
jgi:hypothetical protein